MKISIIKRRMIKIGGRRRYREIYEQDWNNWRQISKSKKE